MTSANCFFAIIFLLCFGPTACAVQDFENTHRDLESLLSELQKSKSYRKYSESQHAIANILQERKLETTDLKSVLPRSIFCLVQWQEHVKTIRESLPNNEGNVNTSLAEKSWHEFFGYVHGKIDSEPPGDWKHFLLNGELPKTGDGYSKRLSEMEEVVWFEVNQELIRVKGGSLVTSGEIACFDSAGTAIWDNIVYRITDSPQSGLIGIPTSTISVCVVRSERTGELIYWGVDTSGICFAIVIADGEIRDRLFFDRNDYLPPTVMEMPGSGTGRDDG